MQLAYVEQLGKLVTRLWNEQSCDVHKFPEVALQAFSELPPVEHIELNEIVNWVMQTNQLPGQTDLEERFGQPPITLFSDGRFQIEIYFWLDGSTDIHEHGFSGAFYVLGGSSVHSQYHFEPNRIYNHLLQTGELQVKQVEVLKQGDCRPIVAGSQGIHSLFHLDRPSTTIVIRTDAPWEFPQLSYKWPSLAHAGHDHRTQIQTRRSQVIALLRNIDHSDFVPQLTEALLTSEPYERCLLLADHRDYFAGKPAEFRKLLTQLMQRDRDLVKCLVEVFKHQSKTHAIHELRYHVRGVELRFFLALLVNLHCRRNILSLTSQQFPDRSPEDQILEWIQELAQIQINGDSTQNALGIDLNSTSLDVLRNVLEGQLPDDPWASGLCVSANAGRLTVRSECSRIRDGSILGPLFH